MNLLKVIILFIGVSSISVNAQNPIVKDRLKKIGDAFEALPAPQRLKYAEHKNKALQAGKDEKHFTCFIAINDAQAIFDQDMDILFLNGVCHAQLHDVKNAVAYYEKVLLINPSHMYTLMNLVEIYFFAEKYEEAVKYIDQVNVIINRMPNGQSLPLFDFKHLIALTKLSEKNPARYEAKINQLRSKYTLMDDYPFYYFANALESFKKGDKQEGFLWIIKANFIFEAPEMIRVWTKALVDSKFIAEHEFIQNRQVAK